MLMSHASLCKEGFFCYCSWPRPWKFNASWRKVSCAFCCVYWVLIGIFHSINQSKPSFLIASPGPIMRMSLFPAYKIPWMISLLQGCLSALLGALAFVFDFSAFFNKVVLLCTLFFVHAPNSSLSWDIKQSDHNCYLPQQNRAAHEHLLRHYYVLCSKF